MDYKSDLQSDDDFDCSNSFNESYGPNNNDNSKSSFNTNTQMNMPNINGLSKAELRKTNKPIMEKRRRARINHCLNELKSLILEAMKKDPARHTKLEKADILEMTVKHLQSVQRQQLNMAIQTDPSVIHKFKTGFIECAQEVNRYVTQIEGVDATVQQRLTNHLNSCANNLEQLGSMTNFNNGYRGFIANNIPATATGNTANLFGSTFNNSLSRTLPATEASVFSTLPQDFNNNSNHATHAQMRSMQLIPSRLPSGEFALIMPNSTNSSAPPQVHSNEPINWPTAQQIAPATALHASSPVTLATSLNGFAGNFHRSSAFSKPSVHNTNLRRIDHDEGDSLPSNFKLKDQHQSVTPSVHYTHESTSTFRKHEQKNNLHNNSSANASPPLSPCSSSLSHGDDSILHTSSEYVISRPTSPPHDSNASLNMVQHTEQQQQQFNQQELGKQDQFHNFSGVFPTPSPSSAESSFSSTTSSSTRLSTNLQQEQVTSTSGNEVNNLTLKRSYLDVTGDSCDSSEYEPSAKKKPTECKDLKEKPDVSSVEENDSMWRPW